MNDELHPAAKHPRMTITAAARVQPGRMPKQSQFHESLRPQRPLGETAETAWAQAFAGMVTNAARVLRSVRKKQKSAKQTQFPNSNTRAGNANPGAPTATLVTTRNNSWVFGVGNDWDNAISRTVPAGQTMVHQYLATVGDTYWVQRQTNPTPVSGTSVTINDTAPTSDRYNLSICEVLPAP